jgi:hypothetical protein
VEIGCVGKIDKSTAPDRNGKRGRPSATQVECIEGTPLSDQPTHFPICHRIRPTSGIYSSILDHQSSIPQEGTPPSDCRLMIHPPRTAGWLIGLQYGPNRSSAYGSHTCAARVLYLTDGRPLPCNWSPLYFQMVEAVLTVWRPLETTGR